MKIIAVEPIGISPIQAETLVEQFKKTGHQFICYSDRKEDEQNLVERMREADVVIISNIKLSKEVLSQCPHLKMISVAFTGLDHLDLGYCEDHHIKVCNASGYATEAVAELAVGLMIDLYRHITVLDASTRQSGTRNNFLGRQLAGKTVGIVGTGAIGIRTAHLLQQFGCKVVAWSRTRKKELEDKGILYLELDELMQQSDIISLHVPLTSATKNLISAEKLELCKPTAIVINTARGNVMDYHALAKALKKGKIAGAGIDVFEIEPPISQDHPLFGVPNCITVPHVGYATIEAFDTRIGMVIRNVENWLKEYHSLFSTNL
ncbi:MAG: NAD(P)-dependent oxidoreductase [Bacteroidales bacterium]